MEFQAGSLIELRNRKWVVLPTKSGQNDLLLIKPLGGSEEEITGIYLPLNFNSDEIKITKFPCPTAEDIGDLHTSKILYNAARLSFRNASGPFRSLAKLSFRPRSYQMVPLIMALKQETVRLLIADDVGIGKTIEALLIVKELIERRDIKRFAVICLPHLCDQWQKELKEKFGIDAVIIRSNTQARLDRDIQTVRDVSVYDYYPYQVISVDYIKSEQRRSVFIQQCPELIIVDEAHTCSKPAGASPNQQQRYYLLHDLSRKQNQNLILLTATPHSGKQAEFQSLIGLLNPDYENLDITTANPKDRKEFAKNYVQRRRGDVIKWMNEDTNFPKRESEEIAYKLSKKYFEIFNDILAFAQGITKRKEDKKNIQRLNYWAALALLRGVMSSPAAGIEMLNNRINKLIDDDSLDSQNELNPILDDDYGSDGDYSPAQVINKTTLSSSENKILNEISLRLGGIKDDKDDLKAKLAIDIITGWLKEKYYPVIFCKYIATANYLGKILASELKNKFKDISVLVITSEDPDEVRKQRIAEIDNLKPRVLIATDCISEGINLQELFSAVLHYDLPWNPNKLEQREGRVDRFGQNSDVVKTAIIHGEDNPIDGVVLEVLIKKVKQIRNDTGVSIPFPEDSKSILDAVLKSILLNPVKGKDVEQGVFEFEENDEVIQYKNNVTREVEAAAEREKKSRSIFAQNAIKAEEIEEDLNQTDESIGGRVKDVEEFVVSSLALLGVQANPHKKGYKVFLQNLPEELKGSLPNQDELSVSFNSPTPEGYYYIGRNHIFVEQLCNFLIANSLHHKLKYAPARVSVIRTDSVKIKTTLLLFRVRNVIEENIKHKQLIAEEMILIGYEGSKSNNLKFISREDAHNLMFNSVPTSNITTETRNYFFEEEIKEIKQLREEFDDIAYKQAEKLVDAHERFRKAVGGAKFKAVTPVLPMDLMGIYILLPETNNR